MNVKHISELENGLIEQAVFEQGSYNPGTTVLIFMCLVTMTFGHLTFLLVSCGGRGIGPLCPSMF